MNNLLVENTRGCAGQASMVNANHPAPTIGENIDRKIAELQSAIKQLEELKQKLSEPNGLLAVSIESLRFAMNY